MFDELSEKIGAAFSKLRGQGRSHRSRHQGRPARSPPRPARGRRQLRADPRVPRAGREEGRRTSPQLKTDPPEQQLVKIVHDELTAMLGERREGLKLSTVPPTVVMMVGLQGSGKTTTDGQARAPHAEGAAAGRAWSRPTCIARPPSISSRRSGKQLNVPVYADRDTTDVVQIVRDWPRSRATRARPRRLHRYRRSSADRRQHDGRAAPREGGGPARRNSARRRRHDRPGRGARSPQGFNNALGITGIILTKMDGDARGGAALSIYGATKKPIKYIGVGEKVGRARGVPSRTAWPAGFSRWATSLSLVEKAQESFDADEAKKLEKKVRREGHGPERLPRRDEADREARAAGGHPEDDPRA